MEHFNNSTIQQKIEKSEEEPIKISYQGDSAEVLFKNLELNAQNQTTPEVVITVEKQPLPLEQGKVYGGFAVLIDKESEKMKLMASQVEGLLKIPENERPRKILEILRNHLRYAYENTIKNLSGAGPELAGWAISNTDSKAKINNIPLSELLEKGYGISSHLAVAYLWLAQKAGLNGTLMCANGGVLRNVIRADTNEKLFKSVDLNEGVPPHMWAEIKTSEGRWIPADPSVKLVGDTKEGMETFQKANYLGMGAVGLDVDGEPYQLAPRGTEPIFFKPGEPQAKGKYRLELESAKPTIHIRRYDLPAEEIPPTNVPYSGKGKMKIRPLRNLGIMNLKISDIKNS